MHAIMDCLFSILSKSVFLCLLIRRIKKTQYTWKPQIVSVEKAEKEKVINLVIWKTMDLSLKSPLNSLLTQP